MHKLATSPEPESHRLPALMGCCLRSNIGRAIIVTYCFWAAFSTVNFDFLAAFAIPIFFLVPNDYYWKFSEFLMAPVVTAVLAATCLVVIPAIALRRVYRMDPLPYLTPFLFHTVFLTALLVCAERAKTEAIEAAMLGRTPDCMVVSSFFDSVRRAGQDFQVHSHALFTENGRTYYWSYSTQRFYEGRDELNRNFDCYKLDR